MLTLAPSLRVPRVTGINAVEEVERVDVVAGLKEKGDGGSAIVSRGSRRGVPPRSCEKAREREPKSNGVGLRIRTGLPGSCH